MKMWALAVVVGMVWAEEECLLRCTSEYPLKAQKAACDEGCRLATVLTFAAPSKEQNLSVAQSCAEGCREVYSGLEEQSCGFGCQHQKASSSGHMEVRMDSSDPLFPIANKAMSDMWQGFHSRARNAFRDFFTPEENAMFKKMDQEMEGMEQMMDDMFADPAPNPIFQYGKDMSSSRGGMREVGNEDAEGNPIIRVTMLREVPPPPPPPPSSRGWLECVRRGVVSVGEVTRWLLFFGLALCIVSLVAIGISLLRPAAKLRFNNKSEKPDRELLVPAPLPHKVPIDCDI